MAADVVNILVLTAIYGIYASGFTLVFGLFDVLNLAHASVFATGALTTVFVTNALGAGILVGGLVGIVVSVLIAVAVERAAFRPLRYRDSSAWGAHMGPMITSLGAASILSGVQAVVFGVDPLHFTAGQPLKGSFSVLGARIQYSDILSIVVLVLVFALLLWGINRTKWGTEIRGVALAARTMPLLGINVERRIIETFALAGALGGLAGVMWVLQFNDASVATSSQVDIRGFAIIVLGGMGSIPGALIGAAILAASEVLSVGWLPSGWQSLTVYIVLIAVLVLRPGGILGKARDPRSA